MIQKIIVLTKRQKNWDYLILNDWFHLLLWPATVSRRCHRAYIFYELFTWVLPQLEIQEKHFFFSLCDVNKRHSLERLRYRRTQTMCDFIGGICGGTHSDNIQIFFFFFRGGGYELIFWSCTHSNTTKISSFRCKRTNSSSSPRRPGGAYVTSAAVTAVLSSNLTERLFQCHYPKLSIPLYCQIKPTCETNKL